MNFALALVLYHWPKDNLIVSNDTREISYITIKLYTTEISGFKIVVNNKNISERWCKSVNNAGIPGEKELRVLLTGVDLSTFWLVLQMLYHWAKGDS